MLPKIGYSAAIFHDLRWIHNNVTMTIMLEFKSKHFYLVQVSTLTFLGALNLLHSPDTRIHSVVSKPRKEFVIYVGRKLLQVIYLIQITILLHTWKNFKTMFSVFPNIFRLVTVLTIMPLLFSG